MHYLAPAEIDGPSIAPDQLTETGRNRLTFRVAASVAAYNGAAYIVNGGGPDRGGHLLPGDRPAQPCIGMTFQITARRTVARRAVRDLRLANYLTG